MARVSKVESSDIYVALNLVVGLAFAFHVVRIGVVHRLSVVSAKTDAQARNGVVVDACGKAILVGHLKFEWRTGTVLHPVVAVEHEGV